ncbi:hypothetical protein H072_7152 [Dactylellina haptotyla CBS 200.50]|uniref:AIG1-type G domain-containing protein n=1 Tax=Dactylellina haptotyla (strain CBS 200.50) TaxID=1284197 RepID=S8AD70_DACHA|nr:hypothetical protein H072_7152 [Dactylellina haptotyla CBS 200.50]
MVKISTEDEDLNMLMVMGVTGAGKSYFINQLVGKKIVEESDSLHSCTQQCQLVPATIAGHKTLIIDTPGFDDSKRTDTEILTEIANVLTAQYELGVKLKGIIYLHRITDTRYQSSAIKTLQMFQKICGSDAMKNVTLCTTRWSEVGANLGAKREKQLKEDFWAYMVHNGSAMTRFYGDEDSARTIAAQIICKNTIVLDIQKELSEEGLNLNETTAGQFIGNNLQDLEKKYREELSDLEEMKQKLRENDRAMRLQIQQDWENEKERLRRIQEQQVSLEQPTAANIRQEITKKRGKLDKIMGFLPLAFGVFGALIGIPPGVTVGITNWMTGDDGNGSFFDLFN